MNTNANAFYGCLQMKNTRRLVKNDPKSETCPGMCWLRFCWPIMRICSYAHRHLTGINFDKDTFCDHQACTDGDGNRMEASECVCLGFCPFCAPHPPIITLNNTRCSPWTSLSWRLPFIREWLTTKIGMPFRICLLWCVSRHVSFECIPGFVN